MSERLPDELARLFDAEKAAPAVSDATRAALRKKLAASIAHLPLGHAVTGSVLGGGGKAIAIVAIAFGVGAGTVALSRSDDSPSTAPLRAIQHAPAESPPPLAAVSSTEAAPRAQPEPIATPLAARRPSTSVAGPSQAELLEQAWTAIRSDNARHALSVTDDDLRLHPDGTLAEERDAIRAVSLAKLKRVEDARSAASRFIEKYPDSVHRALVERTLEEETHP